MLELYSIIQGLNSLIVQDSQSVNAAKVKGNVSKSNFSGNNSHQQSWNSSGNGGSGNRGGGNGNRGRECVRSKSRRGFRSSNNNPTCRIYGKFGHSVDLCYYRGDMKCDSSNP
ncbi:hypothetical protein Syun_020917 [Stephania yunnanensis]|uniref:Uncharacterized protein n=1 Tax=Stephania yunnanensis TaxID=152371 RepID=A0AAP0IFC5_9MAGN